MGEGLAGWGRALGAGLRRAALRGGALGCLALLLLWASLFLYGSFYYCCLPPAALVRAAPFRFRTDCAAPGPELCSFPSANVSLLGGGGERLLRYGQLYRISLELELPESPPNRALGMFMVTVTCYGAGGRPLASTARSAMLHYRSRLLRALEAVAFAGLFLSGVAEQKQTLEIELYSQYREDPYAPTLGAVLEIQSKRIQLYSARLRVHAHFTGLRFLLYHFPLTAALLGVLGNFAALSALLLAGYLQWVWGGLWPRPRPAPHVSHAPQAGPPGGAADQLEEGEAPAPPPEEPASLGPTELEEGSDPPLLTAAAPPPPEEEKMGEGQEGEGREEGEEGDAPPSPLPPSPLPPLRQRPRCSSS